MLLLVSQMSMQIVAQTLGFGGNLASTVELCDLLPVICLNHLQYRGSCDTLDIEHALSPSKTGVVFCRMRDGRVIAAVTAIDSSVLPLV